MNETHINNEPASADFSGAKSNAGRKVKLFAAIVSLVLFTGFLLVRHMKSVHEVALAKAAFKEASAPPAVDVIKVHHAPSSCALTLPGETAAWYESTIYSRVDGYVGNWLVDIGDHVKKGQILANIETPDLDARLAAAKAKLKAAQALVLARQADADFAKTTYTRWKESPKGVVSEQERDAKKAGYEYSVAQLNEGKAQVGLDQALVDQYIALTEFKRVVAPYDGTITERRIDIGNLVSSSNTTPLYRMVKDDPIRVIVFVPQNDAGDIKVGTKVEFKPGNTLDRQFIGTVARTADAVSPQTRTVRVEADIANADHTLVPGMYVNVNFQVPTQGLVEVPAAALVFRPGGPEVGLIGKNNHIEFRRVTIVRDNGAVVELGSGVSAGDRVALNISSQILDGDVVETHEIGEELADVQRPED